MRRPYIDPSDLTLLQALGLPARAGSGTRASDAERDRAVEALRRHHADGRLNTDELEERTERAYAATTLGGLDQLFADLPRLRSPEGGRRSLRLGLWPPAFAVPLIALLFAVAVVTSAHVLFFVWPLMFFLFLRFRFMRKGWWGRPRGWPEAYRHY
jgi:Domain of unknown function (DUF1707)